MSLLTVPAGSYIQRESSGSLTLLFIPLITLTTLDTFSLGTNLQVVNCDMQGNSLVAGAPYGGDASYSPTTGLLTLVSTTSNQGSVTVVVWMRG